MFASVFPQVGSSPSLVWVVTATRRVADNHRSTPPPGPISPGQTGRGEGQSNSLADKIDSLTEAVRRSRGHDWSAGVPLAPSHTGAPSHTTPPVAGTAEQP